MDEIYLGMTEVIKSYVASNRLYLSPEERRNQLAILSNGFKAARAQHDPEGNLRPPGP
jgi:hypothetical protein